MPTAAYGALLLGYRRGKRTCLGVYLAPRYTRHFFREDLPLIRDHYRRTGAYSTVRIEWLYDRTQELNTLVSPHQKGRPCESRPHPVRRILRRFWTPRTRG